MKSLKVNGFSARVAAMRVKGRVDFLRADVEKIDKDLRSMIMAKKFLTSVHGIHSICGDEGGIFSVGSIVSFGGDELGGGSVDLEYIDFIIDKVCCAIGGLEIVKAEKVKSLSVLQDIYDGLQACGDVGAINFLKGLDFWS